MTKRTMNSTPSFKTRADSMGSKIRAVNVAQGSKTAPKGHPAPSNDPRGAPCALGSTMATPKVGILTHQVWLFATFIAGWTKLHLTSHFAVSRLNATDFSLAPRG